MGEPAGVHAYASSTIDVNDCKVEVVRDTGNRRDELGWQPIFCHLQDRGILHDVRIRHDAAPGDGEACTHARTMYPVL